jgi:putative phosphoesterase
MIRIALVSDTHGELDPRIGELVRGCDLALHGGDIGNAGVLTRLRPRAGQVHAVRGNNDVTSKWPEAEQTVLAGLPEQVVLALPGGQLVLIHGHQGSASGRHERLRRQFPNARAIVYGHSHRLVADQTAIPWLLNPGAAGRTRTYGGPSCMVLTARDGHWALATHRFPLAGNAALKTRAHQHGPASTQARSLPKRTGHLPPVG